MLNYYREIEELIEEKGEEDPYSIL